MMNGIVRIYPTDRCLFEQSFFDYFAALGNVYTGDTVITTPQLFEAHFECLGKADQFAKASRDIIANLGYNIAVNVEFIDPIPSE